MLFRYKVTPNQVSTFSNPNTYNHYVKIQMYNENAHIFHWKTIAETTLCDMAYELDAHVHDDFLFPINLSSAQLYSMLTRYENMSNFVKAYVIDILGKSWMRRNQSDECEDRILKFAITNSWNMIEIKEEKN